MSRQNKVNPGMYTQRGRLTPDDAARELAKQREIGSEHRWQPVQRDNRPRLESNTADRDDAADTAQPEQRARQKPARVAAKASPARVKAKAKPAAKLRSKAKAAPKAKAKAPRSAKKAVPERK